MILLLTAARIVDIAISDSAVFHYAKIKDSEIQAAQTKYIRPIVTDALYDRILKEVEEDDVSEEIQTLLDEYINPALAYYVKNLAIPGLLLHITNLGGQKPQTENSTPTSQAERDTLRQAALSVADTFMNDFTKYMSRTEPEGIAEELREKYPEYEKYRNVKNRIKKTGGIVFSRKKYR